MNRFVVAAAVAASAGVAASAHAVVLTSWSFQGLTSAFNFTAQSPTTPAASDGGLFSGLAGGRHASASSVWSSPTGNGSTRSMSATQWAVGDYFSFTSSSLGYSNIKISWSQTSSNTGPRDFGLFYSTDGVNFSQIGSTLTVLANAAPNPTWSSGTPQAIYNFGAISGPVALDNQASITFRLVVLTNASANGGTIAGGGTSRVDDVVIEGTAIPAPASLALAGLGGLVAARRRRN